MPALHASGFVESVTLPERNRAEEPGSIHVHLRRPYSSKHCIGIGLGDTYRAKVKDTSEEEEEAGDKRIRLKKMAKQLGTEQKLEDADADETAFVIKTRDPFLENRGRESGFREEKNDGLDDVQ